MKIVIKSGQTNTFREKETIKFENITSNSRIDILITNSFGRQLGIEVEKSELRQALNAVCGQ